MATEVIAVSVQEAARRLGIGPRSAYRAIERGEIPYLKFGKRIVVPLEALRAYAAAAYCPDTNGNDRREDAAR